MVITTLVLLVGGTAATAGYLPLIDTDVVIVAIGEDQGANIMVTALMKQLQVKRLISRAISPLHETILSRDDILVLYGHMKDIHRMLNLE